MKHFKHLDFHLFDGDGGAGAGVGASSGGSSGNGGGLGEEASAFMKSIGMKEPGAEHEDRIEYGKEAKAQARQVGSDTGGQKGLEEEFAELIGKGGRFHDLYGQKVQSAIQDRFKNQRDLQAQVNSISEDLSPLFMNYGLATGDFEGLKDAIAKDDAFYQAGAEKAGLDVEQYKQNLKLQADAERGRRITEAYEQQQRENEMFAQWEQDSAQLQQAFPGFDLLSEIKANENFANLIRSGIDVQTAFVSTHLTDILSGANQEASRQATQNVVSAISQRAARPPEAGIQHAPAIQRKSDPSKLTDEDMDDILRRVENGEQFSF